MRLVRLTLDNWLCYRGRTVLNVDEKAYAIVARRSNDADSSNWVGKSGVIEAIGFALFGTHRWETEDQWITNGESAGHVHLLFSDGTNVMRKRTRGKRTELGFYDTKTNTRADQDEAQKAIERWLGVDAEMFKATSFFEQKKMSRLILATPKQRMDIVSAWLDLEKIQACESAASKLATKHALESEVLARTLTVESNRHEERAIQLQKFEECGGMKGAQERDAIVSERLSELEATIGSVTATCHEHDRAVRVYSEALGQRNKLTAELGTIPKINAVAMAEAEVERDALASRFTEVERTVTRLALLKLGGFDGTCPVSRGFVCPAKDALNARKVEAEAEYEAVRKERDVIATDLGEVKLELKQASQIIERRRDVDQKLAMVSDIVLKERPAYEAAIAKGRPDVSTLIPERDALREEWKTLQGEIRAMGDLEAAVSKGRAEIAEMTTMFKLASKKATLYRQAATIFGRNGAQRRIAEAALGQIEGLANQLLQDAGIALSVTVRWAREGDGLASSCDKCGAAYPTSAKVKQCPKCSASRGQNLVNKLEILLSNRSGAAEDLAGIAIQLAASQWLRRERGSQVEFAVLDEPFGALDRTNRKALSAALPKMLAAAGIHQAFVIAHTADVLDALPARIAITSTDGCATASVEG